jgi:ParB-like nuclease domain
VSEPIKLSRIRDDADTQARVKLDGAVINAYAEDMEEGTVFPPITVYHDGKDYILADGYHRFAAALQVYGGDSEIQAHVKEGTKRDAILYSVGANALHGLRRTNQDKRRAATTLLNDPEWGKWSDHEIARRTGVTQPFVSNLRKELKNPPLISVMDPTPREPDYYREPAPTALKSPKSAPSAKPSPQSPRDFYPEPEEEDITYSFTPLGLRIQTDWDAIVIPYAKVPDLSRYLDQHRHRWSRKTA